MAKDSIKHDIEANWKKATRFIPKLDEIVIYEPDKEITYYRVKKGDGIRTINDLPFSTAIESKWKQF